MAKGQIFSYDFLVSVMVFTTFISIFSFTWANLEQQTNEKIVLKEMQETAFFVSDILVRSAGNPTDWNESNHIIVGLAEKENIIAISKLSKFGMLNLSAAKTSTTIYPYDFILEVTLVNQSLPFFCYPSLEPFAYHTWSWNETMDVQANSTIVSLFREEDLEEEAEHPSLAFLARKVGSPTGQLDIYLETSLTETLSNKIQSIDPQNISAAFSSHQAPFNIQGNNTYFYFRCENCSETEHYELRADGSSTTNTFLWNSTEWLEPNGIAYNWISYNVSELCAPKKIPVSSNIVPVSRYVLLDFENGTRIPSRLDLVIWDG